MLSSTPVALTVEGPNGTATAGSVEGHGRAVWAQVPTAVHVVAGLDREGLFGATASSVCSLSLDPLLLLLCLDNRSNTLARLTTTGRFAVNALPQQHSSLASQFASRAEGNDKFRGVPHRIAHGAPVLDQALACFSCDLFRTHEGGDHTIVIGAVTAVQYRGGLPLVRHDHRYRSLA